MIRKLRVSATDRWHHRFGWSNVLKTVHEHLHTDDGVEFVDAVEEQHWVRSPRRFEKPWVGFLHLPSHLKRASGDLGLCKGLFVMSEDMKTRLGPKPFPVSVIKYPINPSPTKIFHGGLAYILVMLGHCNRSPEDYIALKAPGFKKTYVVTPDTGGRGKLLAGLFGEVGIEVLPTLPDVAYDGLLSCTYIFLPLVDMAGCTSLNECVATCTPVLIPRLPAAVEYLGKDYPLLYDSLDHASQLLETINGGLGRAAHDYLVNMDKSDLDITTFAQRLSETEVYRNL